MKFDALFASVWAINMKCLDMFNLFNTTKVKKVKKKKKVAFANTVDPDESNRKAMNRNWSNQEANPALKTKAISSGSTVST